MGPNGIIKGRLQEGVEVQESFNQQVAEFLSTITGLLKRGDLCLF